MKLTGWYRGDQKPVRVGVYQRDYSDDDFKAFNYCLWDGERWHAYGDTVKEAKEQWFVTSLQSLPWRGVAK